MTWWHQVAIVAVVSNWLVRSPRPTTPLCYLTRDLTLPTPAVTQFCSLLTRFDLHIYVVWLCSEVMHRADLSFSIGKHVGRRICVAKYFLLLICLFKFWSFTDHFHSKTLKYWIKSTKTADVFIFAAVMTVKPPIRNYHRIEVLGIDLQIWAQMCRFAHECIYLCLLCQQWCNVKVTFSHFMSYQTL